MTCIFTQRHARTHHLFYAFRRSRLCDLWWQEHSAVWSHHRRRELAGAHVACAALLWHVLLRFEVSWDCFPGAAADLPIGIRQSRHLVTPDMLVPLVCSLPVAWSVAQRCLPGCVGLMLRTHHHGCIVLPGLLPRPGSTRGKARLHGGRCLHAVRNGGWKIVLDIIVVVALFKKLPVCSRPLLFRQRQVRVLRRCCDGSCGCRPGDRVMPSTCMKKSYQALVSAQLCADVTAGCPHNLSIQPPMHDRQS